MAIGDTERSAPTETRRKAILDAALACFASKGFTETTMEDIRKLSGASTGSIYHHFANKEMLARELYLEGRNSLNSTLSTSIIRHELRAGIKALVNAYLDWFEQNADLGQYVMQAGDSEYLGAYVKVLRQKTMTTLPTENFPEQFLLWLTPYIDAGSVVSLPKSLYNPIVFGPSREFVRRWLRTRSLTEIQEARIPLADTAWLVLVTPTPKTNSTAT